MGGPCRNDPFRPAKIIGPCFAGPRVGSQPRHGPLALCAVWARLEHCSTQQAIILAAIPLAHAYTLAHTQSSSAPGLLLCLCARLPPSSPPPCPPPCLVRPAAPPPPPRPVVAVPPPPPSRQQRPSSSTASPGPALAVLPCLAWPGIVHTVPGRPILSGYGAG